MIRSLFALGLVVCLIAGCRLDDDGPIGPVITLRPTVELLADDDRFSILEEVLNVSGLDSALLQAGAFTILAPTDRAFSESGLDLNLLLDSTFANNLVRYHLLLNTATLRSSLSEGQFYLPSGNVQTPNGQAVSLFISRTGANLRINDTANFIDEEVIGLNGVIQPIDAVLTPPTVADLINQNELLSEFAAVIDGATPLDDGRTIADSLASPTALFTAFAPLNDDVDDNLGYTAGQLREVALYHLVGGRNTRFRDFPGVLTTLQGDQLLFSDRLVRTSNPQSLSLQFEDIQATNGILHLVSGLLLPEGL